MLLLISIFSWWQLTNELLHGSKWLSWYHHGWLGCTTSRSAEGLENVLVTSYSDIENLMERGAVNRTVAFTDMNATSSRAHALIAIQFTQKQKNAAGQETAKTSFINLVDLAGRWAELSRFLKPLCAVCAWRICLFDKGILCQHKNPYTSLAFERVIMLEVDILS